MEREARFEDRTRQGFTDIPFRPSLTTAGWAKEGHSSEDILLAALKAVFWRPLGDRFRRCLFSCVGWVSKEIY